MSALSKHILIVDDITTNLRLMKALLNGAGFSNIYLESDSRKVSEWFDTMEIDLLILDVSMPHKDGISVIADMKANPALKDIPIIVITALHDPEWQQKAHVLGVQGFFTKPFDQQIFLSQLHALFA